MLIFWYNKYNNQIFIILYQNKNKFYKNTIYIFLKI